MTKCKALVCFLGLLVASNMPARHLFAGNGCCDHCANRRSCAKVCRLVCEKEEIEVTCWACKCEDICIACPSCRGRKHCERVCPSDCKFCGNSNKLVWFDWIPHGAKTKQRKRLLKKTFVREILTYRWVVEDLCASCEVLAPVVVPEPGAEVPPPPPVAAKLKFGTPYAPLPQNRTSNNAVQLVCPNDPAPPGMH